MSTNMFEAAADLKGDITPAQERALRNFVVNLGRENFGWYRAALRITAPIPRLSKSEAHRMLEAITQDLRGPQ